MGSVRPHCVVPAFELRDVPTLASEHAEGPVAQWPANDGLVLHGYRAGGFGWVAIPGLAVYRFDDDEAVAVPDGADAGAIEDAWLRSVLPLVVQGRGRQVLHASAVAAPHGIVALSGSSTAGKSTLAAALGQRGFMIVADDALGFTPEDDAIVAVPLPFRILLRPTAQERLGLPAVVAGEAAPSAPLEQVVILRPASTPLDVPTTTVLTASDAFGALMPHAYCFALDAGKEELVAAYLALVRTVPVVELSYRQELGRLEETLDVLEEVVLG